MGYYNIMGLGKYCSNTYVSLDVRQMSQLIVKKKKKFKKIELYFFFHNSISKAEMILIFQIGWKVEDQLNHPFFVSLTGNSVIGPPFLPANS